MKCFEIETKENVLVLSLVNMEDLQEISIPMILFFSGLFGCVFPCIFMLENNIFSVYFLLQVRRQHKKQRELSLLFHILASSVAPAEMSDIQRSYCYDIPATAHKRN